MIRRLLFVLAVFGVVASAAERQPNAEKLTMLTKGLPRTPDEVEAAMRK